MVLVPVPVGHLFVTALRNTVCTNKVLKLVFFGHSVGLEENTLLNTKYTPKVSVIPHGPFVRIRRDIWGLNLRNSHPESLGL